MGTPRKIDLQVLPHAVANSDCWAAVARRLNLTDCRSIQRWANRLNLDTTHFVGRGAAQVRATRPDAEVFVKDSLHGVIAKRRFYTKHPDVCMVCGQGPIWNHKKLRFQIDHKNGDKHDCRLENLRKICPNCHTQTETWGRKDRMALNQKYDRMLERMQTPEARRRMKEAFDASPEELGKAAAEYAKWCNGCRYGSHCLGADPDCGCGCK
jgi:hypothetical protein